MRLTIDFETRSKCPISCGSWKYSEDISTDAFCLALKQDNQPAQIWINERFLDNILPIYIKVLPFISSQEAQYLLKHADIIEAHNAEFERAITRNIMHKRYGWPDIPLEKWRCSAAKAAVHSLPRKLEEAVEALGLPIKKDMEGHRIMMKLSKPRKPTKNNPSEWHEDPEDLLKLFKYCIQDVDAEHCLSVRLKDLNDYEQQVWFLDQKINERGYNIDQVGIRNVITMIDHVKGKAIKECVEITGYNPTQVAELLNWLFDNGCYLKDLQKQTILDTLEEKKDLPDKIKQVLKLRQIGSKSSTSKYEAFLKTVCKNGRVRSSFMYSGANTGRWSGKGAQPHNLPRKSYKDAGACLSLITDKNYDLLHCLYDEPMEAASTLIRSVIIASPGHDFVCGDFSAIEAKVLAWLAGDEKRLNIFREGKDIYKITASETFNVPFENVDSYYRQMGKVEELALGYQGGWRAFKSMSRNYGVKPPDGVILDPDNVYEWYDATRQTKEGAVVGIGKKLTKEEATWKKWATPIVKKWRDANPMIVQLWVNYEHAVFQTVSTGKPHAVGRVKFGVKDKFLHIQLPSGRLLSYYDPQIRKVKTPWGELKDAVTYMSVDSTTKKWVRTAGYGGKFVENADQGIARDLLVHGMFKAEEAGYPVILHVHDEIVSEVKKEFGSLIEFETLMSDIPAWAEGCPVKAKGWRGERYRKE